jgi:hypothetical protein
MQVNELSLRGGHNGDRQKWLTALAATIVGG